MVEAASTRATSLVENFPGKQERPVTVYLCDFFVSWPWTNLMCLRTPDLSSRDVTPALTIPPRS